MFVEFGEVCARLVDHRAVLHGEINYFLTEFEVGVNLAEYYLYAILFEPDPVHI